VSIRPEVAGAATLKPLLETLPAGHTLIRTYQRTRGPLSFNPTASSARFRPVHDRTGQIVATAYLAADEETALAEGVLRGVTALAAGAQPRRLYRAEVEGLAMARLSLLRAMRVARLHGAGLARLGLLRAHVIDCEEADYPYTAAWAQSLWGSPHRPAGIAWTSRQNDSARAYLLWEPRVHGRLLLDSPEIRLDREPGLDLVRQACVAAGVDFEG
jgi:RES domain